MSAGTHFNDGQAKPAAFCPLESVDEVFCLLKASVGDGGAELSSVLGRSKDEESAVGGGGGSTLSPGCAEFTAWQGWVRQ